MEDNSQGPLQKHDTVNQMSEHHLQEAHYEERSYYPEKCNSL